MLTSAKKWIYSVCIFLFGFTCLLTQQVKAEAPAVTINCDNSDLCSGSLQSGGRTRTFHFFSHAGPATFASVFHVIYILHNENSNGLSFDKTVMAESLDNAKVRVPYLIVYPDAVNGHWNFGPESTATDVDDVAFIKALMEYFETTHNQTPLKNYAVGMANGGLMVFRLGCDLSNKLNAIAVIDATMPLSLVKTCKPAHPVHLLLIEGREDPYLPWNKRFMQQSNMPSIGTLTANETFNYWAWLNNLTTPSAFELGSQKKYDGTYFYEEIKQNKYQNMRMFTVFGGGHTWPGGGQYLPESVVGKTSSNLSAATVLLEFFWSH